MNGHKKQAFTDLVKTRKNFEGVRQLRATENVGGRERQIRGGGAGGARR